jgi:hypothetical protein
MKTKFLTLSLVAALAACNRAPANNLIANMTGAAPPAQGNTGLPIPPERSASGETAMPPGLDCVRNRLTPDQRRAVAQAAIEQAPAEDPRAQALIQAVDACTEEFSWSPEKRRLASMFSVSAAGAAGVREELAGQGVRVAELDRIILADSVLMAAAERGQMDSSVGAEFAQRHLGELEQIVGGQSLESELGTSIGKYIGFRALAEALAGRFGRES